MNGNKHWFWFGLAGLWILALTLRFWGLERFNTLVFDEVYFAKFARNYLTQTPFFDAHPPLGKYMIALGIALKGFSPLGFRWMNALIGSWIPLLIAGIAYELTRRPTYALVAGGAAVLDGLLLVESRYALMNVHLVFFGLLGHWLLLMSLTAKGRWHWAGLTLAAIAFGAAAAVKWNGLGFMVGAYLLWFIGWGLTHLGWRPSRPYPSLPLQHLSRLSWFKMWVYLPILAALIYSLLWLPHLQQNLDPGFGPVHQQILSYHRGIGSGDNVHPYCAPWYTWPLMLRPINYFYQQVGSLSEPVPVIGPPLPALPAGTNITRVIYNVHAMGNPILWWLSTLAILWVVSRWGRSLGFSWITNWRWPKAGQRPSLPPLDRANPSPELFWVPLYLGVNYAANFLPWIGVSRCIFLYHYLPASLFSGMAIAWLVERWLRNHDPALKNWAIAIIAAVAIGFIFWLPLYLGLPLSPLEWQLRIWLPSWI